MTEEGESALSSLRPGSEVTAIFQFAKADVTATLFRDVAELTTAGFAFAARSAYYADTAVYRAVPGEAVFLGDPTGTGLGDPGFYTPAEPAPMKVERGSLVAADTGTSAGMGRVFVALRRMPELDGIATVFGRVVHNLDFLDSLDESDTLLQVHISEISQDEE
jgi:peptidyl-prolyl cis-trans isomerase A (cyclophilin A)